MLLYIRGDRPVTWNVRYCFSDTVRWSLFEWWQSLGWKRVAMLIRLLLWQIESSELLLAMALLRSGLLDLKLLLIVCLLTLEVEISFYNSIDRSHIWIAVDMESPHKLGHILWVLPLLNTLKQAKIHQGDSWCSADPWSAMQVDVELLFVDHVVKMLSRNEEWSTKWIFVIVVNRKSIAFDSLLFINLFEINPRNSSLFNILFGLQI